MPSQGLALSGNGYIFFRMTDSNVRGAVRRNVFKGVECSMDDVGNNGTDGLKRHSSAKRD